MRTISYLLLAGLVSCSHQDASSDPVDGEKQLVATTVGGIDLEPKTVIDGKLSLLVPKAFSVMDQETLKVKYPSQRRPTLVYTNESGSINVAINHTNDRMPSDQIEAFHQQMDTMFRNLYPSATWFESEVISKGGRQWLSMDLRTPAVDTRIRNLMMGTSLEGRLLLISFNVTQEHEDTWLKAAKAIMQSLNLAR